MLDALKFKVEVGAYSLYAKLNVSRKSKEKSNPLYTAVDNIRRRTGFVK